MLFPISRKRRNLAGLSVNEDLVHRLGMLLRERIVPLLPEGGSCAVVDFPNYYNVGDSAIWLGQRHLLRECGVQVAYLCTQQSYSAGRLAMALPRGPILIQGGGNMGDLWPHHQRFRERVIQDFPERTIIQFPQSIFFKDKDQLSRARAVFNAHPNVTLLLRDQRSLDFARNEFVCQSILCPDMAFLLGTLRASSNKYPQDIFWLGRRDQEATSFSSLEASGQWPQTADWVSGEGASLLWRFRFLLEKIRVRNAERFADVYTKQTRRTIMKLDRSYETLAQLQLTRGCHLLVSGRVVVTDRLHGHILSLLLGLPHVVLSDRYGKLRSFWDTWITETTSARTAQNSQEALTIAKELL